MLMTHLINNGPVWFWGSGTSTTSIIENLTNVFTFAANETITWSIGGGADVERFYINETTGAPSLLRA